MKISIRTFLLVYLLLALTLTTFLTAAGSYYLNQHDIHSSLDRLLSQSGFIFNDIITDNLKTKNFQAIQARLDTVPENVKNFSKLDTSTPAVGKYQFQLTDNQGHLLLRSAEAPQGLLAGPQTGFSDKTVDGKTWRIFTIKNDANQYTFAIAEHYAARNYLGYLIAEDDVYIMLLIYPISGLLIWFIIGQGLASIRRVAKEVSHRAADHLSPVDLEAVPLEIQPLVDELNKLFLRLQQAFEREQRFAADAAHELRTPLAALKTQAQVALKITDATERQRQLQHVIAGVDRCTHVIQQLLTLCRISPEAVALEDLIDIDLNKLTAEVIGQLAPMAIAKQIEIELIAKDPYCMVVGNTTGLYAMVRNLIDNAIRYTPEKGLIKVYVSGIHYQIILRVVDNGTGIPPDLRSRVFERFFRVLGTNAQGSGLGLAIVQQIVKLHGGTVRLGSPANGIGLEVEVMLPRKNQ